MGGKTERGCCLALSRFDGGRAGCGRGSPTY